MSSLYVVHGTGKTLSSPNANSTSIKANVRQGVNLHQTTYLAGTSLCAYITSRWRPRSLSSKESRVTYFAITRVCHWVGTCTVNGWQLTYHTFRTKFIPIDQFYLFICSYPERALSVSHLRTLCCHYSGKAALLPSGHKWPEKNKLRARSSSDCVPAELKTQDALSKQELTDRGLSSGISTY